MGNQSVFKGSTLIYSMKLSAREEVREVASMIASRNTFFKFSGITM